MRDSGSINFCLEMMDNWQISRRSSPILRFHTPRLSKSKKQWEPLFLVAEDAAQSTIWNYNAQNKFR